jgi:hypothetical protein
LRDEQEAWIRKEREFECHVLKKACETLAQSGFDMSLMAVKYGHEDDIARNILEEARSGQHETIGMGRQGTSRINQIFGGGVTDQLLRDAKGFAIWVVKWNSQCFPRGDKGLGIFVGALRLCPRYCVVAYDSFESLHVDLLSETG